MSEVAFDTETIFQYLSDAEKATFVELEELFSSKGWGIIQRMAEQKCVDWFTRAADAPTWDANRFANGQRAAWSEVTKMSESVFAEFALKAHERRVDSGEDESGEFN